HEFPGSYGAPMGARDANGNLVLVSSGIGALPGAPESPNAYSAIAIQSFTPSGDRRWSHLITSVGAATGTADVAANALTVDAAGNIYVIGGATLGVPSLGIPA